MLQNIGGGMSNLVWNERLKLLATFLNSAASGFFIAWVIAPGAAFLYTGGQSGGTIWTFVVGAPIGVFGAIALHLAARQVLARLRE